MRTLLILACLFAMVATCCGDDRRGRRGRRHRLLPQAEQPAGISELSKLLDEFRDNLEDADFDDAADLVEEMEAKVKRADVATISHSDYAQLSAAVDRAGADLRAAKKQHAIAEIVEKTEKKLAEAGELNEELIADGPNEDDLDDLDERLEDLTDLADKGQPFRDDMKFAEFAQKRDVRIATFTTTARQYRWLLSAKKRLNDALENANRELDDDDLDDRIDHADDMLAIYNACVEATRDLALAQGFAPGLTIAMPIGEMNLQKTQEVCEARRTEHEAAGHNLRWKREVVQLASAVSEALKNIEAQENAADQLEANEKAVASLNECATRLAKTEEHPGFDSSYLFTTHMGKNSSSRLRDNCAKVRDNLKELQPTLRWRIAVEEVQAAHFASKQAVAEAGADEDPNDRADQLSDTLEGFKKCAAQAAKLAALKSHAGAAPNKNELRAIQDLATTCQNDIQRVEDLIAATENAMSPEAKAKKKQRGKGRKKKKKKKKKKKR